MTHAVTARSSISNPGVPPGAGAGARDQWDVVPTLDGTDIPDATNITTVTFDNREGTINADHSIDPSHGYAEDAAAVDQSDDPSLTSFQAGADVFFDYGERAYMDVQAYEIDRNP